MSINWDLKKTADAVQSEELADSLAVLRAERDYLLRITDHWAYQDTPDMTPAQKDYRQALRDITNTYTSLNDAVWPEKPE